LTKLHFSINKTDKTATWTNKIIIRKLELVELLCRQLGRLICEVGMLVTKACDKYVATKNASFHQGRLLQSIQNSSCHKVCFLLMFLWTSQSMMYKSLHPFLLGHLFLIQALFGFGQ